MSDKNQKLAIFENREIRRFWDDKKEKWYFSVVDIIGVLTEQNNHKKAKSYWTTLKNRLKNEGSEVVTFCDQLKMRAQDGKYYLTDAADTETIFRLIQSIPSPNAEPFKLWLARVGYERVEETEEPKTFTENRKVAIKGGGVAGKAREELEKQTGRSIISKNNFLNNKKKELK